MAGCRQNEELIAELSVPKAGSRPLSFPAQYPTSMVRQTQLLLGKLLISYWRNPQVGLALQILLLPQLVAVPIQGRLRLMWCYAVQHSALRLHLRPGRF